MSNKPFATVYIAYPRKCDMVRCRMPTWLAVKDFHFRTPEDAWRSTLGIAADVKAERPDPADYVIVSGWLTDEQDARGAYTVNANWEHTVDPQSFYDEIERERGLAEQPKEDRSQPPPGFQIGLEQQDNYRNKYTVCRGGRSVGPKSYWKKKDAIAEAWRQYDVSRASHG